MNARRGLLYVLAAASLTLTGCASDGGADVTGDGSGSGTPAFTDASDYSEEYASPMPFAGERASSYVTAHTLSDGRKVALWYSEDGTQLMEQHYSPDAPGWTEPQAIYTSEESDPCQGIDIIDANGTVAAIADFGTYCYDGEPPMESLAIASTGDLTDWQVSVTPGFDGWETVTLADGEATWARGDQSMTWVRGDFSK